jgi:hypothetical protein
MLFAAPGIFYQIEGDNSNVKQETFSPVWPAGDGSSDAGRIAIIIGKPTSGTFW